MSGLYKPFVCLLSYLLKTFYFVCFCFRWNNCYNSRPKCDVMVPCLRYNAVRICAGFHCYFSKVQVKFVRATSSIWLAANFSIPTDGYKMLMKTGLHTCGSKYRRNLRFKRPREREAKTQGLTTRWYCDLDWLTLCYIIHVVPRMARKEIFVASAKERYLTIAPRTVTYTDNLQKMINTEQINVIFVELPRPRRILTYKKRRWHIRIVLTDKRHMRRRDGNASVIRLSGWKERKPCLWKSNLLAEMRWRPVTVPSGLESPSPQWCNWIGVSRAMTLRDVTAVGGHVVSHPPGHATGYCTNVGRRKWRCFDGNIICAIGSRQTPVDFFLSKIWRGRMTPLQWYRTVPKSQLLPNCEYKYTGWPQISKPLPRIIIKSY